ncbi:MAG TPA: SDR family oxidoreductase [Kofleriaceae bacterium]|nr:SDR family oxidoreductase [Kofleriaceae bacterium]
MSTWLVTGANRGIGLELCRQLAARGDEVIATAREPDGADELRGLGVRVEPLELRDQDSADRLARALEGAALDVLVNNAGRGGAGPGIGELDWEIIADHFAVNAIGPMRVAQALLPALRRGRARKIAHLSSDLASIGGNLSGGYYGYRSSKAALNMMNRSLAHELRPEGFICLALHPGWLQTDMGGPRAPVPVADGVARVLRVIDSAGPGDSGKFVSYSGAELPW